MSRSPPARVGPDGSFRIEGLRSAMVAISGLSGEAFLPPTEFNLAPGKVTRVDLRVPRFAAFHGKIQNSRGEPAGGVFVVVKKRGRRALTVRTGPDGKFSVNRFPEGPAELVRVTPDDRFPVQRVEADIPVTTGEVVRISGCAIPIVLTAGVDLGPIRIWAAALVSVRGRALTEDGADVPGARIIIERRNGRVNLPFGRYGLGTLTLTEPGGEFSLALPFACISEDTVYLFRPGRVIARLAPNGETGSCVLRVGHRLTGTVLDSRRRRVRGRTIDLGLKFSQQEGESWRHQLVYTVETNMEGRIELSGLTTGEYWIELRRPEKGRAMFKINRDLDREFVLKAH